MRGRRSSRAHSAAAAAAVDSSSRQQQQQKKKKKKNIHIAYIGHTARYSCACVLVLEMRQVRLPGGLRPAAAAAAGSGD